MTTPRFAYDDAIIDRYPTVVGGVIHARGVRNGPSPAALASAFAAEQAAVRERLGDRPLSGVPSLEAWRRAFRGFGVDPTGYRSAAEALLRRLTKQGSLPSINALVDLGNLVAIRHALPVAIFDQAGVVGGTTVTVTAHPHGFAVHDDGPGFPADLVGHAFERFARGDVARTRSDNGHGPGGYGLGLSLVDAIATAHGGAVRLDSTPGDTTVSVDLPRVPG